MSISDKIGFPDSNRKGMEEKIFAKRKKPKVEFTTIETGSIDDALIHSLFMRYRNSGFDAYLLPRGEDLPMAN